MGSPLTYVRIISDAQHALTTLRKAKLLNPNPPPKIHSRVITWTEPHPSEPNEMVTSGADGTTKVWRNPDQE
jgi:mitogen-activated protein kinase organizer 1